MKELGGSAAEKDLEGVSRLNKARETLQAVENICGIRSYSHRSFGSISTSPTTPSLKRGVFFVGTRIESLVKAVGSLFTTSVWVAVLGVADLGWEAAKAAGWDLKRVVVIYCDESQNATVMATLLEGFDVLVVGDLLLRPSEQKVIAARARSLDRLVITSQRWIVSNGVFGQNYEALKRGGA